MSPQGMLSGRAPRCGKAGVWLDTGIAVAAGSAALFCRGHLGSPPGCRLPQAPGSQNIHTWRSRETCTKPPRSFAREGDRSHACRPEVSRCQTLLLAPLQGRETHTKSSSTFLPKSSCLKALSQQKGKRSRCLCAEPRSSTSPGSPLPCCRLRCAASLPASSQRGKLPLPFLVAVCLPSSHFCSEQTQCHRPFLRTHVFR